MRLALPGALLAVALGVFWKPAFAGDETSAPATSPNQRLCTNADLMGTFVLMDFQETPPGDEAHRHEMFPNQYIAFYPGNYYSILIINHQIDVPKKLDQYLKADTQALKHRTYTLSKDGVLDLYTDKKIIYSYRCVANLAVNGSYQPRDLIFDGYTKFSKSQLYNVYRYWY